MEPIMAPGGPHGTQKWWFPIPIQGCFFFRWTMLNFGKIQQKTNSAYQETDLHNRWWSPAPWFSGRKVSLSLRWKPFWGGCRRWRSLHGMVLKPLDMDDINYLSLNWFAGFLNHQQEGTVYQLCCKFLELGARWFGILEVLEWYL